MSETDGNTGSTDSGTTDSGTQGTGAGTGTVDWQAEAEKYKGLARKHEDRSKANANAAKELEELRARTMTDQEKAVAEAKAAGRAEALGQSGARLAKAEFMAAAATRLDKSTVDGFLAFADLSKFLTAEGEPDAKAIEAAITQLGGQKGAGFDGGARGQAAGLPNMNTLIRRSAGVA